MYLSMHLFTYLNTCSSTYLPIYPPTYPSIYLIPGCRDIKTCFVVKRTGADVNMTSGRDVWLQDRLLKARPYCPCEPMDSEDTLFILYTSGR